MKIFIRISATILAIGTMVLWYRLFNETRRPHFWVLGAVGLLLAYSVFGRVGDKIGDMNIGWRGTGVYLLLLLSTVLIFLNFSTHHH